MITQNQDADLFNRECEQQAHCTTQIPILLIKTKTKTRINNLN